jgi:hypothetical protein
MRYSDLIAALLATGIPFAEGEWENAEQLHADYGVYALDGHHDQLADNHHTDKILRGTVDLYTYHSAGKAKAAMIEETMEAIGVSWYLEYGPHYERDTGFTRREWVFECLPG